MLTQQLLVLMDLKLLEIEQLIQDFEHLWRNFILRISGYLLYMYMHF